MPPCPAARIPGLPGESAADNRHHSVLGVPGSPNNYGEVSLETLRGSGRLVAMFIRRFAIRNFKIHKDTSLTLFPITVFVGPNSGGKSAIFDALINFSMVCRGNLSEAFNQYPYSFEALRHHGASSSARIRYEAELTLEATSSDSLVYMIEFSQNLGTNAEPSYSIHNEELTAGAQLLFSRSDDVCKIPGLSNLQTSGRSIFGAIRHAASAGGWNDAFWKVLRSSNTAPRKLAGLGGTVSIRRCWHSQGGSSKSSLEQCSHTPTPHVLLIGARI